eukprot:TRINITY_DN5495_c0_g1_i1.p1 TRINITY_DN5495_c0_g1~~TRINITY_DN5495_c0_g1_i1.p1  ORF type:complete len:727 (-),score=173.17 TRINITY_DN5495_c0_g1_i1:93-2216(-)
MSELIWQFRDGDEKAGFVWKDFDSASQATLSDAKRKGLKICQLTILSKDYNIDMEKFIQSRIDDPMRQRVVRYVDPNAPPKPKSKPPITPTASTSPTTGAPATNQPTGQVDNSPKACSFEDLIVALTSSSTQNSTILEFLLTYRSICSGEKLLKSLIERSKTDDNIIELRVFILLRTWLDKHLHDFLKDKTVLEPMLHEWAKANENKPVQKKINEIIARIDKPKKDRTIPDQTFYADAPPSFLPGGEGKLISLNEMELRDIESVEIARQITLIDESIWANIQPWECLGQSWVKKDKEIKSPNVVKFTSHFNDMSHWVQTEILTEIDLKYRVKVIQKFIDICDELMNLQNYNGALEIMSGLKSSSVFRLKKTFGSINKTSQATYERIVQKLTSDDNYKALRNLLHNLAPPCIPYLGMFLTDLTFIEDANKDNTPEGLINFGKRKMIASTISEIQRYQIQRYKLRPVTEIQQFLTQSNRIHDENLLYLFSRHIEPRENEAQIEMPKEMKEIVDHKAALREEKEKNKKGNKIFNKSKPAKKSKKPKKDKDNSASNDASERTELEDRSVETSSFQDGPIVLPTGLKPEIILDMLDAQIHAVDTEFKNRTKSLEHMVVSLESQIAKLKMNIDDLEKQRSSTIREIQTFKETIMESSQNSWVSRSEFNKEMAQLQSQKAELEAIVNKQSAPAAATTTVSSSSPPSQPPPSPPS